MTGPPGRSVASPGPSRSPWPGGSGRLLTRVRFANRCVDMAHAHGSSFGLALDRGDTIFVGVFGAACAMAIIGGMQRFP
jgi:hypothetical protein